MEERMLGGSFFVAIMRNMIGAGIMLAVFLLLDRPRYPEKRMLGSYLLFGVISAIGFSVWYICDRDNFVRFAGMLSIPVLGIFCMKMSRDSLYLSLYKLTLGFYLLSVIVFCGVDGSRLWFQGSIWADIVIRIILAGVIIYIMVHFIRRNFLEGVDYLSEEMDLFSMVTVLLSLLIAALIAFWPGSHEFSILHMGRIAILMFMAGVIQYMVYQLYLHRGKERRFQVEKQLLETNEQLIRRQMELMCKSKEELARIRHDARHHCLLIEEYIRSGESDKLLAYVKQYREDVEDGESSCPGGNETIGNILSIYIGQAQKENITVTTNVQVKGNIAVRDIDLVAVIANIFENAIHGCLASGRPEKNIYISVTRKGRKMVIQCRNTCAEDTRIKNGLPESDRGNRTGIASVLKVVSYYKGETEFLLEDGMFVVKILINIPEESSSTAPI